MCPKAIKPGEANARNIFEDLFSLFRSLYYVQANNCRALNFFFLSLEEINLHIWFIPLSITDV